MVAAIELQVDAERRCRHCQASGAVRRGQTRGLRRYSCKRCGKTFHALSGTALSGLHHKQRWLALGPSLVERESVRESAQRCGVAVTTAFRWRHRCMGQAGQLQGLLEADATYVLHTQGPKAAGAQGATAGPVQAAGAGAAGHRARGATAGQVLARVSQASLQAALEPLLASDALLLSDGGRAYPGCARRLGVQARGAECVGGPAGARELSHPNGEQSAPTVQSVPATVPGGSDQVPGQLPTLVSASRIGARGVPA